MYRALLVDDEPTVLRNLERLIPWEEYGVEIGGRATSAAVALELLSGSEIHILVTDVRMRPMSGLELISRAREINPGLLCIVISAHDEFEYAKEAIRLGAENYLLKPINRQELSTTVEKTVEKLQREKPLPAFGADPAVFRENVLTRWLSGTISEHELAERAELAGLDLRATEYAVLAVTVLDHPGHEKGEAVSFLRDSLHQELVASCAADSVIDSSGCLMVLIHADAIRERTGEIRDRVSGCLRRLRQGRGMRAFASLGAVARGAGRVEESCRSARLLQEYRMFCPPDSVVSADEVPVPTAGSGGWQEPSFTEIEEFIRDGRGEEARAYLRAVLERMGAEGGATLPERKAALTHLILHVLVPVRQAGMSPTDFPPALQNLFVSMEEARIEEQLSSWLHSVLDSALSCIRERDEQRTPIVRYLISHTQAHFGEEISLKTFAADNRINASYLGQLFRNETGMLFTDYLNRIRMRRAEELIRTSGLKVSEIARRVGYLHASYFDHAFKKAFGVSPLEYRRRVRPEGT